MRVIVQKGCFNLLRLDEETISVHINVDDLPVVNLNLEVGRNEDLLDRQWPWDDLARVAIARWREAIWISTYRKEVDAVSNWLEDGFNEDRLRSAWAKYELPGAECRLQQAEAFVAELKAMVDMLDKALAEEAYGR